MEDLDSFLERTDTETKGTSGTSSGMSDLDSFLERTGGTPEAPYEAAVAPPPPETPAPPKGETYSANDLVKDEYFNPIKDYMVVRYGTHINDLERDDIVNKFLNNMRGFAGGNSVRSVAETVFLSQVGENQEDMEKVGRAYQIYEAMEGVFGETTFGEKAEAVGDFVRTTVFDPINLIGFGIGKTVTSSGFKAGSQAAKIAAKQAYKKSVAKGVAEETAQKIANRVLKGKQAQVAKDIAAKQSQREALRVGTKGAVSKVLSSEALKEIGTIGAFDGAVAAATDYLYQDAMLRTAVQEKYNVYQTGLSAVAGMAFMGAMAAAGAGLTGLSKIVKPGQPIKTTTTGADLSQIFGKPARKGEIKPSDVPAVGSWKDKVQTGKELQDQDFEFFRTMLLGDDELGLKGLGDILLDQGYVWSKRNPEDKISNFIADVIKNSDPQDAKKFLDDFTKATGIKMVEGKELSVDSLADTFAKKMSDSMVLGNAASQVSKKLGVKESDVTLDQYARYVLFGETPEEIATWSTKQLKKTPKGDVVSDLQNKYIRLLVSNTSTSFLNITGYAAASTLNTASDLALAILHAPRALVGNKASADTIKAIASNTRFKLLNTLDANMTYDRFLQYVDSRPEAMKELYRILPGGVEDVKKIIDAEDIDFKQVNLASTAGDQAIDVIQKLNLVQAQDSITKSIEFTAQLDRVLRLPKKEGGLGIKGGWNEFFGMDGYKKIMGSKTYADAEAKAIDETLRAIYSKSYKGTDTIGQLAGVLEDFRNVPVLGTMVPFGRFFNNTVAMMADSTVVLPLIRKNISKADVTRSNKEIITRGAATLGLIFGAAQYEKYNKDLGLGWSEEIDPLTGAVKDERYEFPYAYWKYTGRIMAHVLDGEEIPDELVGQGYEQFFKQVFRQLGEAGGGIEDILIKVVNGDAEVIDTVQAVGANIFSGSTRFVDPINQAVSIFRGEENYVADNKQGKEAFNNSLRYMDHILDITLGRERPPEKASAARGDDLRPQTTKAFSTVRETKTTETSRMMAELGRPDWDKTLSQYSNLAKADNRFNQVFHNLVERGASNLRRTDRWKKGDLETKKILASKLVEDARKSTRAYMERLGGFEDSELMMMIRIQDKKDKDTIKATMRDMGLEGVDLEDLTLEQLYDLESALDVRDEFKTR